ncbi:MAG: tetratricopeptide repeat protein [Thermotogae bacterium]|nr:tetratricopeptide repeat protein [Thermotogota bacterium]
MIWLLTAIDSVFLKGALLSVEDSAAAARYLAAHEEELPDSLRLRLAITLGADEDSVLRSMIEGGSKDPYVWKVFIFRQFGGPTSIGEFEDFVRRYWGRISDIPEIVLLLGNLYEAFGENEKALKMYERSLELKRTPEALRSMAILLARMGRCDSAMEYFGQLETLPDDRYERRRLLLALGICHDRMGNTSKALEYYQEAYMLRKDTVVGFRIADILANRSGEEALSFLAAMYDDLGFTRPNLHWGYALIHAKDTLRLREGIRELAHYLAISGDDPKARNLLMHAFLRKGDTLTALKHARRAYELEPGDDDYRLAYAFLLSYVSDNPRKFGHLIRRRDERNPLGRWLLARFYRLRGEHSRALKYYESLISMDPGNVRLAEEAYWYARSRGHLRLALEAMRNLTRRYPDSLAFWFSLGDAYTLMGMGDSLHAMYSYLVKHHGFKLKDCEMAAVLNNWAYSLSLLGERLDTAYILADRAYSLCPLDGILDTKGWIYFLMGKRDTAEALIVQAIDSLSDEENENLAELYLHLFIVRCENHYIKEIDELIDPQKLQFYRKFIRSCRGR